jgi:hypothetical protein
MLPLCLRQAFKDATISVVDDNAKTHTRISAPPSRRCRPTRSATMPVRQGNQRHMSFPTKKYSFNRWQSLDEKVSCKGKDVPPVMKRRVLEESATRKTSLNACLRGQATGTAPTAAAAMTNHTPKDKESSMAIIMQVLEDLECDFDSLTGGTFGFLLQDSFSEHTL